MELRRLLLADGFLVLSVCVKFLVVLMFLYILRTMRIRRAQALAGDPKAAKRIILPCYKPVLRGIMAVYVCMGVVLFISIFVDWGDNSLRARYHSVQGLGFLSVVVFAMAPVLLLQRSVSATGFWRTGYTLLPWFTVCVATWIIQLTVRDDGWAIVYLIVSCVPPLVLYALMLAGTVKSRMQLKSYSNVAAVQYASVYTLCYLSMNIVGVVMSTNRDDFSLAIAILVLMMFVMELFFPLALYRTLLADTKYWRGLGRHNKGGIKAKTDDTSGMDTAQEIDAQVASGNLQEMLAANQDVIIDFAHLKVGDFLGQGSTSDVYNGFFRGEKVAIKVFTPPEVTADEVNTFAVEAAITASLRHPNVIKFHGICVKPPQIAMVFEMCKYGNLKSLLRKKSLWPVKKKLEAAVDAVRAVAYLHSRNIIHRDIKAENFFVDEDWNIKLGDFGESTLRRKTDTGRKMTIVGTVAHMAPEMILAQRSYTEAIDVYSLAITLWEIWTGDDPFKDLNTFQVYAAVAEHKQRPAIPDDCLPGYRHCIEWAWSPDPADRPTASELADELQNVLDMYLLSKEYDEESKSRASAAKLPSNTAPSAKKGLKATTSNGGTVRKMLDFAKRAKGLDAESDML